jgi:hypothetical protein
MLEATHPTSGTVHPNDKDGLERAHRRVEQRIVGMHVPADDVGSIPTGTVFEHRHAVPRWSAHRVHDGDDLGRLGTAHQIVVAVRQYDDVTPGRFR